MRAAAVEIDRVAKRYGDLVALAGLTVRAEPGEVVGLIGGPAAGKTTALRIAFGLVTPDSGAVRIGGEPVGPDVRALAGYLPQRRGLPAKVRVLDHLVQLAELHGVPTNSAHRAAEDQLAALGLRELRATPARALSPAKLDRVLLAGALVHNPAVLLLDEPFDRSAELAGQVLREHAGRGAAVLIGTADLAAAERFCDRVVIVRSGQKVAEGTIGQLRGGSAVQVVVDVPDAPPGWAEGIAGVEVVSADGSRTVLRLSANADDQVLLRIAMAAGRVRAFSSREPTLADLLAAVVPEVNP